MITNEEIIAEYLVHVAELIRSGRCQRFRLSMEPKPDTITPTNDPYHFKGGYQKDEETISLPPSLEIYTKL